MTEEEIDRVCAKLARIWKHSPERTLGEVLHEPSVNGILGRFYGWTRTDRWPKNMSNEQFEQCLDAVISSLCAHLVVEALRGKSPAVKWVYEYHTPEGEKVWELCYTPRDVELLFDSDFVRGPLLKLFDNGNLTPDGTSFLKEKEKERV